MSQWSESIYSEPNTSRWSNHGFLSQLDSCLYEGVHMEDVSLDAEARQWATRFLHLRLVGTRSRIHSGRPQQGGVHWSVLSEKSMKALALTALSRPNKANNGLDSAAQPRAASDHLPRLSIAKKKK